MEFGLAAPANGNRNGNRDGKLYSNGNGNRNGPTTDPTADHRWSWVLEFSLSRIILTIGWVRSPK